MGAKKVIAIVGMPGSGKGILDDVARELGIDVFVMGDIIKEEAVRRGFEITPENIGKVMLAIRSEEGPAVVASRCIPKILRSQSRFVVIDGVRSLDEVEEFKRKFSNFSLVAIHASPKTRFERLFNRRRGDDPTNWKIFKERDIRELKVGIGSTIAMADHVLTNDRTINQFKGKIKRLLQVEMV